jgi:hypothetical protein
MSEALDRALTVYAGSHAAALNRWSHRLVVLSAFTGFIALGWAIPRPDGLEGLRINWALIGLAGVVALWFSLSPRATLKLLLPVIVLVVLVSYAALHIPPWALGSVLLITAWTLNRHTPAPRATLVHRALLGPLWLVRRPAR